MNNIDELIDKISNEAEPVTLATPPIIVSGWWMLAIFLYINMFVSVVGLREDFTTVINSPLFILEILTILATIITTAIAASLGSFPDRARHKFATWAPLIPLALFIAVIAMQFYANMGLPHANDMGHLGCIGWICMLSLLPATGLFLLLSRGICLYPRTAYAHAALASAMTAYLVLRLEEAHATPLHLILMHIIPMCVVILAATYVARLKIFSPLITRTK